jgi:hypothetical protein
VNTRKLFTALAGIALVAGTGIGVALPAGAAGAAPSPSPSPSPSPPPQAPSCTTTSNQSPGWVYGILPSSTTSNVQVSTTIQIIPGTTDGRAYLAYEEAQVRQQQARMQASPAPVSASTPASYLSVQTQSENFSALARRLGPYIETTSTDSQGNWACADLSLNTPYLLFVALTVNTTTSATAPPAAAAFTGNAATTTTQTTQYYYSAAALVRLTNRNSPGFLRLNLPFNKFTKIAQIDQPS